jgi:hypothetical protein
MPATASTAPHDPGNLRERDFSRGDAGSIFWYDIVAPAAVMVLSVIT